MGERTRTDFKKNNKIGLRNFKEASDFHDLCKTELVKMLRRLHPDNHATPIYTEYDPVNPREDFPDIWMRLKTDIIVFEIQEDVSKKWLKQIQEQYETVDLIIIPLKEVLKDWKLKMKKVSHPVDALRTVLEVYVV